MPFDPEGFLAVARHLHERASGEDAEAFKRTAVGRLYYAMFLKLRLYLREQGTRTTTFGSVFGSLRGDFADVGLRLEQLHALRNRCDYDDANNITDEQVARAFRIVELIQEAMAPHR